MDDNYLFEESTHHLIPSPPVIMFIRFIGVMPPNGVRFTWKYRVKFLTFYVFIGMPVIVGIFGYVIKQITDGPTMELITGFYYIAVSCIQFPNMLMNSFQMNKFENYIKNVSVYRFGLPRGLLKKSKYAQIMNITSIIGFIVLGCCQTYASLYMETFCGKESMASDGYVCDIGFPAWFPFKINPILRRVILSFRWFAILYVSSTSALYIIFLELILVIGLRLQHIRSLLRKIDLSGNLKITKQKLHFCIRYHNEIIRLANLMNNSIGYMLIAEYAVTLILALAEYEIFVNGNVEGIILWIIYAVGPVSYCELGNMLEYQSERLRQDVYGMNWYDMSPEIRNNFKLLLGKVQQRIHLTAQPLMIMNRITLWNLMNGAVNVLMFLKNVVKEK